MKLDTVKLKFVNYAVLLMGSLNHGSVSKLTGSRLVLRLERQEVVSAPDRSMRAAWPGTLPPVDRGLNGTALNDPALGDAGTRGPGG